MLSRRSGSERFRTKNISQSDRAMALPSSSAQHALELLGSRLRELRVSAGLSGRDLGRLTGWHSSKVSKIEYGRQAPTAAELQAWCLHCGAEMLASELTASLHAVEGMFL